MVLLDDVAAFIYPQACKFQGIHLRASLAQDLAKNGADAIQR